MNKKQKTYSQIHYANCWEDADVLLEALNPKQNSNILSIGSGGDNSLALLASSPALITVIDANIFQLYLIELKKVAFQLLNYHDLKMFLGFENCTNRLHFYKLLKPSISINCRNYWNTQHKNIEKGIIHCGKIENYFRIYRKWILPFITSKKMLKEFYKGTYSDEQKNDYVKRLDNYLIKLVLKLYFSRKVMSKLGRSNSHFTHVNIDSATYLFNQTREYILSNYAHLNNYIRFLTIGNYNKKLPYYIREENYVNIKKNLHKIELKLGFIQDILPNNTKYQYYNLSNIFEYLSIKEFMKLSETIVQDTSKDTKFAYWNLFVTRKISDTYKTEVEFNQELSQHLKEKDKIFFYKDFIVETKK